MSNLEIREFRKAIIDFANRSNLPIEVKKLCFDNILNQISKAADEAVILEIKGREKLEQESKKEGESDEQSAPS